MWSMPSLRADPGATISSALTSRGSWRCSRSATSSPACCIAPILPGNPRLSGAWAHGTPRAPRAVPPTLPAQPHPPRPRLPALLLHIAGPVDRAGADRVAPPAQALCAQVPASPAVDGDPPGALAAPALAEAAVLLHEAAAVVLVEGDRDADPAQVGAAAVACPPAQAEPVVVTPDPAAAAEEPAGRAPVVDAADRRLRMGPPDGRSGRRPVRGPSAA